MATTIKDKLDPIYFDSIIEEGKRPKSPDQIKSKYQLEFPFTVQRVVKYKDLTSCSKCGARTPGDEIGDLLTFTRHYEADGSYVYETCRCGIVFCIFPDSERFILANNKG